MRAEPLQSISKALYDHDAEKYGNSFPAIISDPEKYVWGIEAKRFLVMMKAYEEAKK